MADTANPDSLNREPYRLMESREHSPRADPPDESSTSDQDLRLQSQVTWPANTIPVEIFAQILSNLPRASAEALRLVCLEFDAKVSCLLFRSVVIPFWPEFFTPLGDGGLPSTRSQRRAARKAGAAVHGVSDAAEGYGRRLFWEFGSQINRFAMCDEVDEETLLRLPTKRKRGLLSAFWGHDQRHSAEVARLEDVADKALPMIGAFSHLSRTTVLALSIDNGLGWLSGPDTTWWRRLCRRKPEVFGRDLAHAVESVDQEDQHADWDKLLLLLPGRGSLYDVLKGIRTLREAVQLETPFPEARPEDQDLWGWLRPISEGLEEEEEEEVESVPQVADDQAAHQDVASEVPERNLLEICMASSDYFHPTGGRLVAGYIKPNALTPAQMEWLLEVGRAQRALLCSYALAILSNKSTLGNVHTLQIARLPSRYLPLLHWHDFWSALDNLRAVSLLVVPEWRELERGRDGQMMSKAIQPSSAVACVFTLLAEYLGPLTRIKRLRIGWIGGGEFAAGSFARFQHVMPAPVVPRAVSMLEDQGPLQILDLPHVEELAFCNCWFSPGVLTSLTTKLIGHALKTLWLESVSLTAVPAPGLAHSLARTQASGASTVHTTEFEPYIPFPHIEGWANGHHADWARHRREHTRFRVYLAAPRAGSWPEFIDRFSSDNTLAQMRDIAASMNVADRSWPPPPPSRPGPGPPSSSSSPTNSGSSRRRLSELLFTSCGYVRLPLNWDQTAIIGPTPRPPRRPLLAIHQRREQCAPLMQPLTDGLLGQLVPHMRLVELAALRHVWGLVEAWPPGTGFRCYECVPDGQPFAGLGRFNGAVAAGPRLRSASRRPRAGWAGVRFVQPGMDDEEVDQQRPWLEGGPQ
ncbi:MAG: hypothetical protein M1826_001991 [Phylliscum demangeonii]|nr:MAG: hypothetical protein M1826_001991 [Phylliscum demangeonii]